jgi:hypothetical protein
MHNRLLQIFILTLCSQPLLGEVVKPPQVVHLGRSAGGGHFAVVNAGTEAGFDAGSEICLFDAKDRLVLCTQVLIAKRRAAALNLTRKQFLKTIPTMTARLSSTSGNEGQHEQMVAGAATTAHDDRLELAPRYFFRDGRSAEEITRIERALSRVDQASPPPPVGSDAKKQPVTTSDQSQFKVVATRQEPERAASRRFRLGYTYHLKSPLVFNHLRLRSVSPVGELNWTAVKEQTFAPYGADLALLFPSKGPDVVLRIFGGGTETKRGDYKFSLPGQVVRDNETKTSSYFYGVALGGSWPLKRNDGWTVWVNPGLAAMRSIVNVSVAADSVGDGKQQDVAKGQSTLNIVMPELSSYVEWVHGYSSASVGLQAGVPWLVGTRKLDGTATAGFGSAGSLGSEDSKSMLESLAHDRSKYALSAFVAGSTHF